MVERTIRSMAKERAAKHYEWVRAIESMDPKVQDHLRGRCFKAGMMDPLIVGKVYPSLKDYLTGKQHGTIERLLDGTVRHVDDGSISQGVPGWMNHIDGARKEITAMLGRSDVHENLKQGIYKALIEDREKQIEQQAKGMQNLQVPQRKVLGPLN